MNGDLVVRVGWRYSRAVVVLRDWPGPYAAINAEFIATINNHLDSKPHGRDFKEFDYLEIIGFDRRWEAA